MPILVRWESSAVREALTDDENLLSEYNSLMEKFPEAITFGLNSSFVKKHVIDQVDVKKLDFGLIYY